MGEQFPEPGLQEPAIRGLLADGGQRPGDPEQQHEQTEVAVDGGELAHVLALPGQMLQHRDEQPDSEHGPADAEQGDLGRHATKGGRAPKAQAPRPLPAHEQGQAGKTQEYQGREVEQVERNGDNGEGDLDRRDPSPGRLGQEWRTPALARRLG